jgi:hypothetical protein
MSVMRERTATKLTIFNISGDRYLKLTIFNFSGDSYLKFDDEKDDKGADYHTVVSTIENPCRS